MNFLGAVTEMVKGEEVGRVVSGHTVTGTILSEFSELLPIGTCCLSVC